MPEKNQLASHQPSDIPATVYLNERYVLDMLASIEDGFRQSVQVSKVNTDTSSQAVSGEGELAAPPWLALIGLRLGGQAQKETAQAATASEAAERTHTLSSLFARLRNELSQRSLITELTEASVVNDIVQGDFVEARVRLQRNGFLELIQNILTYIELQESMGRVMSGSSGTAGQRSKPDRELKKQMNWLLQKVRPSDREDLLGVVLSDSNLKVVIPVDASAFFDPSLSDALSSELRVLGKVTRILTRQDSDAISLLRGTGLGALPPDTLKSIFKEVETEEIRKAISLPSTIEVVVGAPAVQLLPIGIFA